MVVHKETITVIERVVTNRYESVYNQNQTEIEPKFPPKTTMSKRYTIHYGAPHRGRKENTEASGPRGFSAVLAAASVAKDRLNWIPNGDDFNEDMFRDLAIWGGIKGEYIIDVLNVYPITRNAYSHTSCSITQVRHIIHGIYRLDTPKSEAEHLGANRHGLSSDPQKQ